MEYCVSNPMSNVDPTGLVPAAICQADYEARNREARADWRQCQKTKNRFCNANLIFALTQSQAMRAACLATSDEATKCVIVVGATVGTGCVIAASGVLTCGDGPLPVGDACAAGLCLWWFGGDEEPAPGPVRPGT